MNKSIEAFTVTKFLYKKYSFKRKDINFISDDKTTTLNYNPNGGSKQKKKQ